MSTKETPRKSDTVYEGGQSVINNRKLDGRSLSPDDLPASVGSLGKESPATQAALAEPCSAGMVGVDPRANAGPRIRPR